MSNNYNPYSNLNENENKDILPYEPQRFSQVPIKPSNGFETAAMALGIAAITCCTCFYGAYVFGALAILFALLSRGGQIKLSSKAKLGLILGIAAIVLTTIVTVGSLVWALEEYGSIENIIREYCNMYGYDYEEFMNQFY